MAELAVRIRLTEGGRVVIPTRYRHALGLRVGDDVILRLEEGEIRLTSPEHEIRRAQALVRTYIPADRSLVTEFLAERREDAARE